MPDNSQTRLFLSYARSDDVEFVRKLYKKLVDAGFWVWFDEVDMPSRQLTFLQEIRDTIAVCHRLVLIVGPGIAASDYIEQEWRFAIHTGVCVNPVVRLDADELDGYELIPEELKLVHAEDFRDDSRFAHAAARLIEQLTQPVAPLGKLFAVPELPVHYRIQRKHLQGLRDQVLADVHQPVVVSGAAGKVGVQGMGGIGKSVLAAALARDVEVRRGFPDGVLWIRVGQQPNLLDLVRRLIADLGERMSFHDLHSAREALRASLETRATLIIADDVWKRSHIDVFDVIGPRCRLLVTTRDNSLVSAVTGKTFNLDLPGPKEAYELLAAAAKLPSADRLTASAKEVVTECGRLPLALAICGAMVAGGVTWDDLLDALQERDLEFVANEYVLESHHASVWRAIEVSVRALSEDMRQRFSELAAFPTQGRVPEAAVITLWNHTAGFADRHARKCLVELHERSLIQLNRMQGSVENRDNSLSCHDLIYDFAVRLASQQFGSSLKGLHTLVIEAYAARCPNGWPSGPADGYFFNHLRNHLVAAGRIQSLTQLVQELGWLEAKFTDNPSLTADAYDLLEDFAVVLNQDKLPVGMAQASSPIKRPDDPEMVFIAFLADIIRSHGATWIGAPNQLFSQLYPFLNTPSAPTLAQKWLERYQDDYTRRAAWFRQLSPLTMQREHVHLSIPISDKTYGLFAFGSGGQRILGVVDGCYQVWSLATGRQLVLHRFGHEAVLLRERPNQQDFLVLLDNGELHCVRNGSDIKLLAELRISVLCADLSTDGATMAIASTSGLLGILDVDSGCWRIRKRGSRVSIRTLCFDKQGIRLILSLKSGICRILNATTLEAESKQPLRENALSVLRMLDGTGWIIGCLNGSVKHVAASGEPPIPLEQTGLNPVCSLVISGDWLMAGDTRGILRCWQTGKDMAFKGYASWADGTVRSLAASQHLYVVRRDGEPLQVVSRETALKVMEQWRPWICTKPVWSSDSSAILVGDIVGQVLLQSDVESSPNFLLRAASGFNNPAATAESIYVAGQSNGISVVDYKRNRGLGWGNVAAPTTAIDIDVSSELTVSGHANGDGVVWDTQSAGEIGRILMHVGSVTDVLFLHDSSKVVSGGKDGTVAMWHLKLSKATSSGRGITYVHNRANPDLNVGFVIDSALPQLLHEELWRVRPQGKESIEALALSPDETEMAIAIDGTIALWSLQQPQEVAVLPSVKGKLIDIKYSPDGHYLAGVTLDAVCVLWRLDTRSITTAYKAPSPGIGSAWHPNGTQLAVVAGGALSIFDLQGLDIGPPVVWPRQLSVNQFSYYCPIHRGLATIELDEERAGQPLRCPTCNTSLILAPGLIQTIVRPDPNSEKRYA